ncbi:dermonecrotic toxin domain-containing protein [Pseudomonas sp. MC6]
MTSLLDKQPNTLPNDETVKALLDKINDWDKAKILERFISHGLPNADAAKLAGLRSTLVKAIPYQNYFEKMLRELATPEKFCGRMLRIELQKQYANAFRNHDTITLKPAATKHTAALSLSLLHAAMLNFTDTETGKYHFSLDSKTQPDPQDAPFEPADQASITAHDFAALSRTLDLGGAYQKHLNLTFEVSSVRLSAVSLGKLNMRLAAYEKSLTKRISDELLSTLVDFTNDNNDIDNGATFNQEKIRLMSVKLFRKYTIHATLIVCRLNPTATQDSYILYIPNDPGQGFYEEKDEDNIRTRLATHIIAMPSLRSSIASHLNNIDQDDFLNRDHTNMSLKDDIAFTPLDKCMFHSLFMHRLDKLLSDVKEVAVPVANVNESVHAQRRENHLRHRRPPLSATLIYEFSRHWRTTAADALLGTVFTGLENWTSREKHTALGQLLDLQKSLAATDTQSLGADASGESAGEYFKTFEVQEHPHLQQGYRLWKRALTGYEVPSHVANRVTDDAYSDDDDRRVLNFNGRHYIQIDATVYEVEPNPLAWRIRHPLSRSSYQPAVVYSPSAGWRLHSQQAVPAPQP